MEAVLVHSDKLSQNLSGTLELLAALTAISKEKEMFLTGGDIESLRAATEREEELVAELTQKEKEREKCAGALSRAIGLFGKNIKLAELIERIDNDAVRRRLTEQKNSLNDAVRALEAQNGKLAELLALKMNYTDYMLNMIYVPKSRNHTYDVQGSRKDVAGDLSLMDFHV
jgi:hypothetical protein